MSLKVVRKIRQEQLNLPVRRIDRSLNELTLNVLCQSLDSQPRLSFRFRVEHLLVGIHLDRFAKSAAGLGEPYAAVGYLLDNNL